MITADWSLSFLCPNQLLPPATAVSNILIPRNKHLNRGKVMRISSNSMLLLSDIAKDDDLVIDPSAFTCLLKDSILHWKQQEGFYYHHAEPSYLMLVHWIPQTPNTLPPNATHRVGVGAFVMRQDDGHVLVVQEKGGKMRGSGVWKFPTGVVDEGEDICDAAVREVKEETGVDTKFIEILAFRQSHKKFFDKSDLFFMCMLEPLSFQIQKQDREIEAAQWMSFEEYAGQPFVQKHDLPKHVAEICSAKIHKYYNGFSHVSTLTSFSKQQSNLYLNTNDLNSY